MQQKMVRRAENEAKRRAQSMARNKAHQMVGQAKRKGRQAVRSGVTQLGDNVKGKKPVSIGTNASSSNAQNAANRPSVAQRPSAANNPNTRRPKTGNKGEISI